MRKVAILGVPLLVLFVLAPMFAAVVLVTMTGQVADCLTQQPPTPAGAGAGVGAARGGAGPGEVRVAQANIKTSLPGARFAADLDRTLAPGPDLVSLNEVGSRPTAQLTRPGYAAYRNPTAVGQARSTAVLWATDRWAKVDAGLIELVAGGPQKWDTGRAATWVTLTSLAEPGRVRRDTGASRPPGAEGAPSSPGPGRTRSSREPRAPGSRGGATVSMVAVHHMINPRTFGPDKPRRRQLYRQGMVTVANLVATLSVRGPVFVAGDFNSQYSDNDPWGPRRVLAHLPGAHAMAASMDALGRRATHDGGGSIDYVFYQPAVARPTGQRTASLNSDHHLLQVDFTLASAQPDRAPGSSPAPAVQAPAARAPVVQEAAEAVGAGEQYNLGPVQPQLAALVGILAPRFDITTVGGYRTSATDPTGHPAGLAADFMVPLTDDGRARGTQLATYARQHADALGVDYVLWRQRIWSTARSGEGWRPMEDRGSPTQNHMDHVHINVAPDSTLTSDTAPPAALAGAGTAAAGAGCDPAGVARVAAGTSPPRGGPVAAVWPVPADLAGSDRRNWGGSGSNWTSWHTGTDFSVGCGTPVLAAHTGRINIDTTQRWAGPELVKVATGPQGLSTWYAHMGHVSVADGQGVTAGQQIGEVGNLGNVSGPSGCHLHFEVHTKNGSIYGADNVDPSTWLAKNTGEPAPAVNDRAPAPNGSPSP